MSSLRVIPTALFVSVATVSTLGVAAPIEALQPMAYLASIELPRGAYRVIRQREYAPEAPRQVAD